MRYTSGGLAFPRRKDTSFFAAEGTEEELGEGTEEFGGTSEKS